MTLRSRHHDFHERQTLALAECLSGIILSAFKVDLEIPNGFKRYRSS